MMAHLPLFLIGWVPNWVTNSGEWLNSHGPRRSIKTLIFGNPYSYFVAEFTVLLWNIFESSAMY